MLFIKHPPVKLLNYSLTCDNPAKEYNIGGHNNKAEKREQIKLSYAKK
jgi:hypothetical protein